MRAFFRLSHGLTLMLAFVCVSMLTSCPPNGLSYTLTKQVSPSVAGTVTADPPNGLYASGTEVELTANPASGFVFDHWEGAVNGLANPITLTITANATATAVFLAQVISPDSWAKTFGGTGWDEAFDVQPTSDGGYILAGRTYSYGAGGSDMYLVKLDAAGELKWSKTFGGTGLESARAVRQTPDGGYILAGSTNTYGAGGYDFYVVKTNSAGVQTWAKTYGGTDDEYANDILVGTGGYYILGSTTSNGGDMWLAMINQSGLYLGGNNYGGSGVESGESICKASDSGYILAGWTTSYGAGGVDAYLVKVFSNADFDWSATYGGTKTDYVYSVVPRGIGYFLAGSTNLPTAGEDDMLVVTANADGFGLWGSVGWTKDERARDVIKAPDNGFAMAGDTTSFGAGGKDFCLVKLSSTTGREWDNSIGGADAAAAITLASGGGYVLAGYTESFGAGGRDIYVVKTNADGDAPSVPSN